MIEEKLLKVLKVCYFYSGFTNRCFDRLYYLISIYEEICI